MIFFTRLPFWRLYQPPHDSYKAVVEFWPLTGWLTAACMAGMLYVGSMVFPLPLAIVLAMVARVLLTGALHEDGLADFIDGFGGGGQRDRILAIMKDSHIGTYGVLGLIAYAALLFWSLYALGDAQLCALAIIAADPYSKMLSGQLIQMMPYARREEEAKNKVVYRKTRSATRAYGDVLHAVGFNSPLGVAHLRTLLGDVFPLYAHLAQTTRIHRRLLRSRVPVSGVECLSDYGGYNPQTLSTYESILDSPYERGSAQGHMLRTGRCARGRHL